MAEDSRTLIREAFERARRAGRTDWFRMTVAVLKNRLLDATQRAFKETDYGAATFLEFVRKHEDILELDETVRPPVASLKGESSEHRSELQLERSRIRPDLWRAVLDFSSGEKYFWDSGQQLALGTAIEDAPGPVIPTITADTFTEWKRTFAEGIEDERPEDRLAEWVERRRPSNFLPTRLRHRWHAHLKTEVQRHLASWFEQQTLDPPKNMLVSQDSERNQRRSEELRKSLITCLRSMTMEELERVQIPASALLRLRR